MSRGRERVRKSQSHSGVSFPNSYLWIFGFKRSLKRFFLTYGKMAKKKLIFSCLVGVLGAYFESYWIVPILCKNSR